MIHLNGKYQYLGVEKFEKKVLFSAWIKDRIKTYFYQESKEKIKKLCCCWDIFDGIGISFSPHHFSDCFFPWLPMNYLLHSFCSLSCLHYFSFLFYLSSSMKDNYNWHKAGSHMYSQNPQPISYSSFEMWLKHCSYNFLPNTQETIPHFIPLSSYSGSNCYSFDWLFGPKVHWSCLLALRDGE